MRFLNATPNLPVLDIARSVAFYVDRMGFENPMTKEGYAILRRDDVEIHLWAANQPGVKGAEPEIAGTASCRVRVDDVRLLYDEYNERGVVHPNGHLTEEPWGELRFTTIDPDNNAINFYQPVG